MAKKILYFIDGPVPTDADRAAAAAIGTKMFRNASQVAADEKPEACEGVAGAVPVPYRGCKLIAAPVETTPSVAEQPANEVPAEPEAPEDEAPAKKAKKRK